MWREGRWRGGRASGGTDVGVCYTRGAGSRRWCRTDSTIAPFKTSVFLQRTHHGCSAQGRILLNKKHPYIFFVCKGLTIDDVGMSRNTVFQEIRPGAGFETADFVKEKLGGLP